MNNDTKEDSILFLFHLSKMASSMCLQGIYVNLTDSVYKMESPEDKKRTWEIIISIKNNPQAIQFVTKN